MTYGFGMGYGGYPYPTWGFMPTPPTGYFPGYPMGFTGFPMEYTPGYNWNMPGWGLGGLRTWGGTYSPQYTSTGLPTDEEIEEMIYDALDDDPIVPYDADIDVDVSAGLVTLSGTVPNKRVKHAVGDDAWWIPGVVDVVNNVQLSGRRRVRSAPREGEGPTPKTSR